MQLDPKAVVYFLAKKSVFWLFFSFWLALIVGAAGTSTQHPHPGLQWGVIGALAVKIGFFLALLLLIDALFCYLKARSYRFDLRDNGVALVYGVFNQFHETLLYTKIQDILIRRSVLERLLGLSTVVVQNAAGQPQVIPGLGADAAEQLRDDILGRIPRT
jgi:membrane protein YdbS with pleckstrin-like domain